MLGPLSDSCLSLSFDFFYANVTDQVSYLAELLDKRIQLTKQKQEQKSADSGSSFSSAEDNLLQLLLSRFTTFQSGALLMGSRSLYRTSRRIGAC